MSEITTRLGSVRGADRDGVLVFQGLPYAAPPVGQLRFRPPVPAPPWSGTFDATEPHHRAWQPPPPPVLGTPPPGEMDEDCQCLTVTTPAADRDRRPVLVWIHGGGFTMGSASEYDASVLAAQGDVVVVTVNYRLGVFGFLDLSAYGEGYATSANNGLLDQVQALQWVRDNIADYGGDPDNVTIFGESAGGLSVLSLLAVPAADGLYHRAVAQSAGKSPLAPWIDHLDQLAARFDCAGDALLQVLLEAEPSALMAAQGELVALGGGRVDGVVITRSITDAIREGGSSGVPLIVGSNRDEGTLFGAITGDDVGVMELAGPMMARRVMGGADATSLLEGLHRLHPDDGARAHYERIWTDFFRRAAVDAASAAAGAGAPVWLYRFDLPSTVNGGAMGATHASDIAFTFNTLGQGRGLIFHDPDDDVSLALAQAWSSTIVAFARNGDPNGTGLPAWPAYDLDRRPCLLLDAQSRVVDDPDAGHRALWMGE